jgi:hypothetical protein
VPFVAVATGRASVEVIGSEVKAALPVEEMWNAY